MMFQKSNETCRYDPNIDDMVPETVECALKGVYGSLWNVRAIDERIVARYIQSTVAMGVAVLPQYKEIGKVTANAVCITRLVESPDKPGYTFSIGEADNDVTNPEPGTQSETAVATANLTYIPENNTYTGDFNITITRFAIPVAGGPELTTVRNCHLQ
jgi:hypothetical protein